MMQSSKVARQGEWMIRRLNDDAIVGARGSVERNQERIGWRWRVRVCVRLRFDSVPANAIAGKAIPTVCE